MAGQPQMGVRRVARRLGCVAMAGPDRLSGGAGNDVAKVDAGGLDAVHRSCERVREDAE